jgi:hypothetical protein
MTLSSSFPHAIKYDSLPVLYLFQDQSSARRNPSFCQGVLLFQKGKSVILGIYWI